MSAPSYRRGENWLAFVTSLFFVLGCFNVIDGLAALLSDDYFHVDELLFGDLTLWGWVDIIVGLAQIGTGVLIWRGNYLGALFGVSLAALNAVTSLLSVGAYPVWSVIILILDGVVIYALTVYGTASEVAD